MAIGLSCSTRFLQSLVQNTDHCLSRDWYLELVFQEKMNNLYINNEISLKSTFRQSAVCFAKVF